MVEGLGISDPPDFQNMYFCVSHPPPAFPRVPLASGEEGNHTKRSVNLAVQTPWSFVRRDFRTLGEHRKQYDSIPRHVHSALRVHIRSCFLNNGSTGERELAWHIRFLSEGKGGRKEGQKAGKNKGGTKLIFGIAVSSAFPRPPACLGRRAGGGGHVGGRGTVTPEINFEGGSMVAGVLPCPGWREGAEGRRRDRNGNKKM